MHDEQGVHRKRPYENVYAVLEKYAVAAALPIFQLFSRALLFYGYP